MSEGGGGDAGMSFWWRGMAATETAAACETSRRLAFRQGAREQAGHACLPLDVRADKQGLVGVH